MQKIDKFCPKFDNFESPVDFSPEFSRMGTNGGFQVLQHK